ncbi:MAG: murein L,D-transpeptidase catalytic domain family protein [Arenimonas sp.]
MRPSSFIIAGVLFSSSQCFAETTQSMLSRLAPDANPNVLNLALEARDCAAKHLSQSLSPRLAVIDYSLPSTAKRLWIFDIETRKLLFAEYVAHGQGTGENYARDFSNRDGSHQTSLGLFRTAETYNGKNGYSLKMEGLEPGTNDAAMARAIVMHGAPYVNPAAAKTQGRLGRSWGCPAVRPEVAGAVIDSLKNGQMIFAYYPDTNWLAHSPFIDCRRKDNIAAAQQNAKLNAMSLSDASTAQTAR